MLTNRTRKNTAQKMTDLIEMKNSFSMSDEQFFQILGKACDARTVREIELRILLDDSEYDIAYLVDKFEGENLPAVRDIEPGTDAYTAYTVYLRNARR